MLDLEGKFGEAWGPWQDRSGKMTNGNRKKTTASDTLSRIPRYLQVATALRQRINSGQWAVGEKIATLGAAPNWAKGSGSGNGDADGKPGAATRKVFRHFVQRTLTPLAVTFSSGILNRVWHLSHWAIIGIGRGV
jgi:hypothetical protein